MENSPCFDCDLLDQDKNNDTCRTCSRRVSYAHGMGGGTESLPIGMTDMADKKQSKRKPWTEEDAAYLLNNYMQKTNSEMAAHLGRTAAAVWTRMSLNGLSRKKGIGATAAISAEKPKKVKNQFKDFFILDLSAQGDLYERIITYAAQQLRTPENQIIYLLQEKLSLKCLEGY